MSLSSQHTEHELLQRTATGDELAFSELFHRYRNKIYTVAYKLTASIENAEEMVQDVFLKVWTKREGLNAVEDFDSWLFIITRNTVYSFLRSKEGKAQALSLPDTAFTGITPEADTRILDKEYQILLQQAIELLTPQQKQVYHLSKDEGLSYDAIAQQLGIASETVRKHLQYAMRSIRAYVLSRIDLGVLVLLLWKTS